jgi:hypothetical protein
MFKIDQKFIASGKACGDVGAHSWIDAHELPAVWERESFGRRPRLSASAPDGVDIGRRPSAWTRARTGTRQKRSKRSK